MFGMLERHSDIQSDRRFAQFSVSPSDHLDFRRSYRKVLLHRLIDFMTLVSLM